MKKSLLISLLSMFLTFQSSFAQNVTIPDANFKTYLVGETSINTNMDGEIQVSEAEAFTGTIACNSKGISDLTGIEAFVNLTVLICANNQITSIDVSNNSVLTELRCHINLITSLDITQNPNISFLWCNSNQLTSLNVANGNNINFTSIVAYNNASLSSVEVDDVDYSTDNWSSGSYPFQFDAGIEFTTSCFVEIPDANFKAALVADNNIDTDMDDEISCEEAEAFTGTIDVGGLNVSDVTGLEAFTNLTGFAAVTNQISTIDLTALTKLETLNLNNNSLSSIDVSNNTALTFLALTNNNLSSIDLDQNTALTVVSVSQNNITTLDVSMLTELIELFARSNSIETLDLANNSKLRRLVVYSNALTTLNVKNGNNSNVIAFSAHTNPSLNCITVDDVTYSETNWTQIDDGVSFSTDCSLENSISKVDVLERSLYPNPTNSFLYVETQINSSYKVMNLFGQEVLSGELNAGTNQINVNALENGVYYLVPERAKTYRFVKH